MLEYAKQHGYSAFIHTAAASAIGGMLLRLSKARGIEMIHIVRRAEQIAALKSQGATYVLNSTDPHFDTALAELCKRLNVRLAFDAVGGDLTNRLVHAMPRKSKVRVYGALSGDEIRVQIPDLLFQEKSVEGFWLSDWIRTQNLIKLLWASRQALGMLGGTLKTEIRARYPLQKIHDALQDYQHQMTGGKVLITPNAE
jgi:NADPH:quinone reductase-like Zn-dependent oxidoreductase